MEKIWLKSYEKDVPAEINPDTYPSLVHLAQECFAKYLDKPCCRNFGENLTYREIDLFSQTFAHFLQETFRLSTGDRIALMLPNIMQYPVALWGGLRAGLTIVNINPLYTPRELKAILRNSGARCIVVLANFAHVLEQVLPETKVQYIIVTEIGDLLGNVKGAFFNFAAKYIKKLVPAWNIPDAYAFKNVISFNPMMTFEPPLLNGDNIAFLQYTGGTMGKPKGTVLTHRNMIANIMQASAWIQELLKKPQTGIVTALPLYHIFSLTANWLLFFKEGILNIFITNPRDIPLFVKELKRQPFSIMTGVNTLFNALLNNEAFCRLDFSHFTLALGGGMAVQKRVAQQWKRVTHTTLIEAYGLTETSPAVTINPLNLKEFNGSIGLPIPSTEVKICDDEGKEVPIGQPGELYIRGPQVMKEYWEQPDETRRVLDDQGWFRTEDIVTIDEQGFICLIDRKKDIIIVSGFNVYPNEVEDVIAMMPQVHEVGVVGVSCPEQGEKIKAFIVKKDPTLTVEQVMTHCHQQLTHYKIPREIEFRNELPKTNVGKILRRALKTEESKKK